jgi:hypothetical protein
MFWLYLMSFFLPVYLMYWTFSLLVLFVIKCLFVIHDKEARIKTCLYPAYHTMQFLLLAICVLVSYLLGVKWKRETRHGNKDLNASWDQDPSLYVAFLYGMLTVVGAYYSYRCYELVKMAQALGLTGSQRRRREKLQRFLLLLPIFFVIFLLRALWGILYYFGSNPVQKVIGNWIEKKDTPSFNFAFLVFYAVFEIIPETLVIVLFSRNIPSHSKHSNSNHAKHLSSHKPLADATAAALGGGGGGGAGSRQRSYSHYGAGDYKSPSNRSTRSPSMGGSGGGGSAGRSTRSPSTADRSSGRARAYTSLESYAPTTLEPLMPHQHQHSDNLVSVSLHD